VSAFRAWQQRLGFTTYLDVRSAGTVQVAWKASPRVEYREIKTRPVPPQGSSEYLGWSPPNELKAFSAPLGDMGRTDEAKAIFALAAAQDRVNKANFVRLMDQRQGRDPRGNC